jgi:hypothetical protein
MSVPGVSAQRGYQFQDYVALYYVLELLRNSDLLSVEVESTGLSESEHELHVDDVIMSYRTGRKKFVQVKMNAEGMTTWNMKSLKQKGELEKIVQQLKLNVGDTVELICPHGFGDLEEVWNDNSKFHDVTALNANGSQAAKARLNQFCAFSELDEKTAFSHVRHLAFGPRHRLQEWEDLILERLAIYVEKPDRALEMLLKFVKDHQCKHLNVPGLLTADVLRNSLDAAELLRPEAEQPPTSTERKLWKAELIVTRTSYPMELKPIGRTDFDPVGWKSSGPQFILAVRPRRDVEARGIDYLEEKFGSKENVLPTFSSGLTKVTARIKDGLCVYDRWTQSAPPPTVCQRFLSKFSSRFVTPDKERFVNFTYICGNGELCMSHSFRLKSGYQESDATVPLPKNIEQMFVAALDKARATMRLIGEKSPYECVVQISGGIHHSVLPILDLDGRADSNTTSACDEISIESVFVIPSEEISSNRVLQPFFSKLWESLRTKRPAYYDDLNSPDRLCGRSYHADQASCSVSN